MNQELQERRAERARLGSMGKFTVTFEATESTLNLIKGLLLYGDRPEKPAEPAPEEPFPFDAPTPISPEEEAASEAAFLAAIDFTVVRRTIQNLLTKFVERYDREKARELIRSFGGETVSALSESQLLDLVEGLERIFPPPEATPRRRRASKTK